MEANKFIILTTQRTGSTYLRLWLNNHPEIESHGEILMPESRNKIGFPSSISKKTIKYQLYTNYILNKLLNKYIILKILFNNYFSKEIYMYLNNLFYSQNPPHYYTKHLESNIKATGFKLMYNQIENFKIIKKWIKTNKPKIIYLERADKIAQCNSKYTAKVNKLHHTSDEIELSPYKANRSFFRKCLRRQKDIENKIKLFLNKSNSEILHIYYEDFVGSNCQKTKKKILSFLSVNHNYDYDVHLKKINKVPIKNFIKNYDEIVDVYKNIYV